MLHDSPIVLFDGVCTLCDASVQFVIERDKKNHFHFASLQSTAGKRIASQHGISSVDLNTVILIAGGRAFVRSDAVLGIMTRLGRPWSWLGVFRIVPLRIRDIVYRVVARNRSRWFGRRDVCRMPTPALLEHFLDP